MAQKRMFNKKITETDAFIDMPISSQLLYFHLNMNADDDGFVASPKRISRMIGCSDDDLKVLIGKRFIIPFPTGVCVIKHWWIHNTLQKDRHQKTTYSEEFQQLTVKDNKVYTECYQNDNKMLPQSSVVKIKVDKKELLSEKSDVTSVFNQLWNEYPNKVGKKAALRSFKASVKSKERFQEIKKSLNNYLKSERVMKGFIQNGSTWFANWEDWTSAPDSKVGVDFDTLHKKSNKECRECFGQGYTISPGSGKRNKCGCVKGC